MSSDTRDPNDPDGTGADLPASNGGHGPAGRILELSIEDELKGSYLTYAMSVIIARALPDVRDGLKPSQRRILVAMNDLNLGPTAGRVKCAKISGDTSGNYHPHGESVIYPTLVRMAQEWNMRAILIDKQGNFGSIAGLPPAAMRYTEARLSHVAAMLLDDLKLDTVDYVPTYDERGMEPTVLPSKFPNLLVNGSSGIAVSMATSIPPHNTGEVCDALIRVIDDPEVSIDELMEIIPGPDFPTGGIIQGRSGIRRGYHTGRSTITLRARAEVETIKGRNRIVIHEIPFQQYRDRVIERIAELVNEDRIKGISGVRDESDLNEPVRIIVDVKRDHDPEVVLNQLYQFSPLQDSISIMLLALVDGKPREMSIKAMMEEFIRHRVTVIRRRTQFLLSRARKRKHTIEGLLLALANIDEIIRIIRASATRPEAKAGLMTVQCPTPMLQRALGEVGFAQFQKERGIAESYSLSAVQADAILNMTLGQLVNLEHEKLGGEHQGLLEEITEYLRILGDESIIFGIIKDDLREIKKKFADDRRTEISGEEIGTVDMADLITEETMVVVLTHKGYIKRTASSVYRAQNRGGKGLLGAKTDEEDPIEQLFVASTHDYLMFFTNRGKVHWLKVYDLPELSRERKGRAIVNLLSLEEGEKIAACFPVRDFEAPEHYLMMATRKGLVKKTPLAAYGRPMKRGIIAINLKEDDELIDVTVCKTGDEILLASAKGQAVRFRQSAARAMGRAASGVRGIKLRAGDSLVGMVVADPSATLLTVCENGYGKRTPFGPNSPLPDVPETEAVEGESAEAASDQAEEAAAESAAEGGEEDESSSSRYPTKGRGTLGVRDIRTTDRNGPVIAIARLTDADEVLMMTKGGKIQRIRAADISVIGRNTQGVRIMSLDEGDSLAAVVPVPQEEEDPAAGFAEPDISPMPPVPEDSADDSGTEDLAD